MKNRTLILLIVLAAAFLLTQLSKAQNLSSALSAVWQDTLGSTNMTYAPFFERKLTGNANKAGMTGIFNLNDNAAVIGGFARQWVSGAANPSQDFTLSGGFQLKAKIYPFATFGYTNFSLTPWAAAVIGTPVNGANGGNLMNCNRAGLDVNLYSFPVGPKQVPVTLGAGAFYGNETGCGPVYDGNWAGGYARVSIGAPAVTLADGNGPAVAWSSRAFALAN